ncbi:MAG: hypothetical protein IKU20_09325 [Lachnospiraceae bacterium]|nr:hypothetical protein [Lachnospiraceae bacterium]
MRKSLLYTMGLAAAMTAGMAVTAFAGWSQDGGNWYYYHDRSGNMITDEWVKSGDYYYYLGHDGKMVTNSLIDDQYYVDANGARVTNSWQYLYGEDEWDEDETGWRYFGTTGKIYQDGMKEIDKVWYHFDNGIMTTGWKEVGDYTYYFKESGARATGWHWLADPDEDNWGEYWYYFGTNGKMAAGTEKVVDDVRYIFDREGRMLTGWVDPEDFTSTGNWDLTSTDTADLLFFSDNGASAEGWQYMSAPDGSDDYWFYFKEGRAYSPEYKTTIVGNYGMAKIDSKTYCFDAEGHLVTGLIRVNDGRYFFFDEDDGTMVTGRATITTDEFDEQEFYFATSGSIGERGAGFTGMKDSRVYDNGIMLCAEDGMKYEIVEIYVEGEKRTYLVAESGKIKTSGTVKDGDGVKYKVTKSGNSYNIEIVND